MIMKRTAPTDLNEIAGNPQKFNFYDYPAYTFDSKYANDEFQKKALPKGWFAPSHAVCRRMTCSV